MARLAYRSLVHAHHTALSLLRLRRHRARIGALANRLCLDFVGAHALVRRVDRHHVCPQEGRDRMILLAYLTIMRICMFAPEKRFIDDKHSIRMIKDCADSADFMAIGVL